jgi:hypothetical protein
MAVAVANRLSWQQKPTQNKSIKQAVQLELTR